LSLIQIALLVCPHLLLGPGSVSAQSGEGSGLTSGRIIRIEPKGALKIRQAKGLKPVNATEGMLVHRGYMLILAATARATVICGDGRRRELASGPQGCPCTETCTPEVCGINYDGSTIRATRGPDTDKGTFPAVISPRKTLLANLRPTIRWAPIAGAKEKTTYNVTLYGEGMKMIWARDVVAQTRLAYPENETPLAPGQTYKVVVASEGLTSQQDQSPGLGFTTLTADQALALADEEENRKKLSLSELQTRFLVAVLYAGRELYSEAIEQLEDLNARMKGPEVISMLGDLYATAGLNREAERKYLEALHLTPANDLARRGETEKSLALVYENLGNISQAIARLREAIIAYRRLKNVRMVNTLLNEERRLEKLQGHR
jgi:hypothetical protein